MIILYILLPIIFFILGFFTLIKLLKFALKHSLSNCQPREAMIIIYALEIFRNSLRSRDKELSEHIVRKAEQEIKKNTKG